MATKRKLYFDFAAATPLDSGVKREMEPFYAKDFYNASAIYQSAREVRQAVETSRARVASILSARSSEVVFTAGATESINLAVQGVLSLNKGNVVISGGEHAAIKAAAQARSVPIKICRLLPDGQIDLSALEKLIDSRTVLVSVQHANNEIGAIQPLSNIAKVIANKRKDRKSNLPLYFHSDASQATNYLSVDVARLGVDLLTINGSKIYGPKYSGCLYVKYGTQLSPLIAGGGQEMGVRGGTENVAGIVGFSLALEKATSTRDTESRRLKELQNYFIKTINDTLDGVSLNGSQKTRLPNNINVSIKGVNGETLVHHLDQAGFMVATGAACSANQDSPSPTLRAIGLPTAAINSSLRITMGRTTTKPQLTKLLDALNESVQLLRGFSCTQR